MTRDEEFPLSWNPLTVDVPRALLAALTVVVLVALVLAASTSTAAFGAYNPAWDGASELRDRADAAGADAEVVLNTSSYADRPANRTVAVVLSPDRPYGPADAARVRQFVRRGGTLVVAEDFGPHGNALLGAVGADARFDGAIVRDERRFYRTPAMPRATNVSSHPLVANMSGLTLNHGTVLESGRGRPIVWTSAFAYLDRNRNGTLDLAEALGTYPVVSVEQLGTGRVIAVSDPSLFINVMLERRGNAAFVARLFANHDRVLLDYSHATAPPPLAVALLVVRREVALQLLVGGLALGAVALLARRPLPLLGRVRDWRGSRSSVPTGDADREAVAAYLRAEHPDWDPERVERVTEAVMSGRPQPESTNE